MRPGQLVFFVILFIIFILVDFYAFQGFKMLVKKWASSYKTILYWMYWLVPIGLWATVITIGITSKMPEANPAFKWSMVFLIGFFISKTFWLIFLLIDDIIRGVKLTSNSISGNVGKKISRSSFLVTTGAILAGSAFGTLLYGIFKGAHNYQVLNRKLRLKNLPKAFDGIKIAQISDVHSGSFWSKSEVERGIDLIMTQNADLIFFTGDLVNNTSDEFDEWKEIFNKLKAPLGVFSVLGNHDYGDYYSWPLKDGTTKRDNLDKMIQHHKDMNWNILLNESRVIEKDGEKLGIIGVENWSAKRHFKNYGDLKKAHKEVKDIENKLLLSHDPSHWQEEILTSFPDIDATFSGHTHGMQMGIDTKHYRWSPAKFMYKEWADLYQENGQYLYVNRGFGYLGYPGRIGFYPEITVFELESC